MSALHKPLICTYSDRNVTVDGQAVLMRTGRDKRWICCALGTRQEPVAYRGPVELRFEE